MVIDFLINGSIAIGFGYVAISFVTGLATRRPIAPVVVADSAPTCEQCSQPAEWPSQNAEMGLCQEHWEAHCSEGCWETVDAVSLSGEFLCDADPSDAVTVELYIAAMRRARAAELSRPVVVDNVVPFHRPRRPVLAMPTDRELIELAKSTDFPGAKKWSFSRPLSQKVRASLLEVWQTSAA